MPSQSAAKPLSFTMNRGAFVGRLTIEHDGIEKSFSVQFKRGNWLRRAAQSILQNALFPMTPHVDEGMLHMAPELIERHLYLNPVRLNWRLVTIDENFSDFHILLFRWIREIEMVQIYSNRITDRGVRRLGCLKQLKHLLVYSDKVTDKSLSLIRAHRKLEVLDMQASPGVSRELYFRTVESMNLKRSWPPHKIKT